MNRPSNTRSNAKPKLLFVRIAYAGTQVSNTWAVFVRRVCLPNTTEHWSPFHQRKQTFTLTDMPDKKPNISPPVYGVRSGPFSMNGPNPNMDERNDLLLTDLAHRVERLRPSHRGPEDFHAEKSEIAYELRRLARAAGRGPWGSGRGRAG